MKKLLAIILCAVMLLSAAAFAEGKELTVSNVVISGSDGTVIDLSGIDVKLALGQLEDRIGLRLALGGNGEEIASGVASMDASRLLLTAAGLSSVYAFDMEEITAMLEGMMITEQDIEDLMAVWSQWEADMEASITDAGTEEIEGVVYQNYTVNVSADACDRLYTGIIAVLDRHPMLVSQLLADTGYNSLAELYADLDISASVEGTLSESENDMALSAVCSAEGAGAEEVKLGIEMYAGMIPDEANGTTALDITAIISEIDEEESEELVTIGCNIVMLDESGEFYGMDGYFIVPDGDEYEGMLFGLYSPVMQGAGLWQLSFISYDQSISVDMAFGETEGVESVYASAVVEDVALNYYHEIMDGAGTAGVSIQEGDMVYEAAADIAVADVESDWVAIDGTNAVDILNISDEEMQQLYAEGLPLIMGIVSDLASANETVAALLGEMM